MIYGSDFYVRVVPFPNNAAKALVSVDESGFYNIYINANYPRETQAEALSHELRHIQRDDFYNGKTILEVEEL